MSLTQLTNPPELTFPVCTFVVIVPASSVIVLEQLRTLPSVQQEVHLMLLPPGEGLAQKLPGFVKVKISGPQEAQYMLVLWDLRQRNQR